MTLSLNNILTGELNKNLHLYSCPEGGNQLQREKNGTADRQPVSACILRLLQTGQIMLRLCFYHMCRNKGSSFHATFLLQCLLQDIPHWKSLTVVPYSLCMGLPFLKLLKYSHGNGVEYYLSVQKVHSQNCVGTLYLLFFDSLEYIQSKLESAF